MIYGSVCSGIEAASVAWHPLGWSASFLSEIEPFPRAVLQHHYPEIPLHGDFTTIQQGDYEPIELLVGGTPCQSFSIAGLRGGMADERGNLALEYLRLADRLRPRWLVWENVPGVLSSNGGRDFGSILGGMVKLGYGVAYRMLDAQHFGVPQRRRRVFVVGYLGDWRCAAAVLFERHSLSGNPAPSRQARERVAPTISSRPTGGGGLGTDFDLDGGLIARSVAIRGRDGVPQVELGDDKANAILTPNGGRGGVGVGAILAPAPHAETSPALKARDYKGVSSDGDGDGAILVPMLAPTLRAGGNSTGGDRPPGTDVDTRESLIVTHSLRADGFDASEDGTGRGTPLVPVAFDCKASGRNGFGIGEQAPTLRAMGHADSHSNAGGQVAVAFAQNQRDEVRLMDVAGALAGEPGMKQQTYIHASAVRRLTPRECERLQGFPDDYTLIQVRGKPAADGPRYKVLGNSMAVPCMAWIGARINLAEGFRR